MNAGTCDWTAAHRFESPPLTSLVCGSSEVLWGCSRRRDTHSGGASRTQTSAGIFIPLVPYFDEQWLLLVFGYFWFAWFLFLQHWIKEYLGIIRRWHLDDLLPCRDSLGPTRWTRTAHVPFWITALSSTEFIIMKCADKWVSTPRPLVTCRRPISSADPDERSPRWTWTAFTQPVPGAQRRRRQRWSTPHRSGKTVLFHTHVLSFSHGSLTPG